MRRACVVLMMLAFVGRAGSAAPKGPAPPKERKVSYIWDLVDNTAIRPLTRTLDPALGLRKLTRHPREAANVDEHDDVRLPSTWWQPRVGFREVTPAEMTAGPGPGTGPAAGRWKVTKAKSQGITPGFQIKDPHGDGFLLKFDPPTNPEMASGAEVIGTMLFWAAGYNVPDNAIVQFRRSDLVVDPKALVTLPTGRKTHMTDAYLDTLLSRVPRARDGRYRALASRLLEGKPLGPFSYIGRRKDDPEDLVPHQLRRELRGLWTMAAWLNHADIRGPNSLDMWVEEYGHAHVRHYLIDFGSILGSSSTRPHDLSTGTEYYIDARVMGRQAATLGLAPFAWEPPHDPHLPAVGFVDARYFDPEHWRPDYPNPAFDERTQRDIRWGVRIVGAMTDDLIRAAVARAHYSDPRATAYLYDVIRARRDAILREWPPDRVAERDVLH